MWQESISGNLIQDLCSIYGITEPINGSWFQAFCGRQIKGNPLVSEPFNGSWEMGLLKVYALNYNEFIDLDNMVINGNIWQSIWIYINGEVEMASLGYEGINYAINGNWFNNFYQLMWLIENI